MAVIAKAGTPSLASALPPQSSSITGLVAGEAIAAGDICYIDGDGTVKKSDGGAADDAARCDGIVLVAAATGEAVSLYFDVNVRYGAGLTPGERVYVSETAGALEDVATTGGLEPVGFCVDATRIRLWQSRYTEIGVS